MMGGVCVGFGRIYSKRNNIVLSAGILFVAAGRTRTSGLTRTSGRERLSADVETSPEGLQEKPLLLCWRESVFLLLFLQA